MINSVEILFIKFLLSITYPIDYWHQSVCRKDNQFLPEIHAPYRKNKSLFYSVINLLLSPYVFFILLLKSFLVNTKMIANLHSGAKPFIIAIIIQVIIFFCFRIALSLRGTNTNICEKELDNFFLCFGFVLRTLGLCRQCRWNGCYQVSARREVFWRRAESQQMHTELIGAPGFAVRSRPMFFLFVQPHCMLAPFPCDSFAELSIGAKPLAPLMHRF